MELRDFMAGECFYLGGKKYLCTDKGSRTIAAICLSEIVVRMNGKTIPMTEEEARKNGWLNGPPYSIQELALDEYDIEACTKHAGVKRRPLAATR